VINACASLGALEKRQAHFRKRSFKLDATPISLWGIASLICNAICRSMEEALTVFCRTPSLPGQ